MKFCPNCNNLFYTKIEDDTLMFHCKYCQFSREFNKEDGDSNKVFQNSYKDNSISYREQINEYTHLDPTLPRVNNIDCPNIECVSHSDPSKKEVIYIKYDIDNMNYIYLCCNCRTTWKSDS